MTRRDAVKIATVAGGAAALAGVGVTASWLGAPPPSPTGAETVRSMPETPTVPKGEDADLLVRMQEELRRALAKPVEERRWTMVIDTRKCVGCHACTVACIAENRLPPGVVYRPVLQTEIGTFPNVALRFTPRPCMQCDSPPCVPVCPVEATWKRPDGITAIDYDRCIGCGYCVTACPYNARTRDLGERYSDGTPAVEPYDQGHNHEYLKAWSRDAGDSPVGNVRKCHFCLHRLEEGLLPQCVTTCIGRANYFGDARDPDALVNQQAASPNAVRLLEHHGTRPAVVYLV